MGIDLLFGIHCHQPVDNFHYVIKEAIEKSYKPFFKVANRYENFKFAVHYSGWLLEFIKEHDKELFKIMQEASEKGIVEFFTGGYYEPVLAAIPSDDRKIQIEKLNNFIKENFKQEPKGLWLTERVWDDSIVKDIVDVGVEYVIVDDYHFISLGFKKEQLHGYYITEEEGYRLKIFPIDKTLRYITPFKPVDKVMEYLNSISQIGENKAGIIFDDGEKFGIWPETYQWVYEKKWLEKFIEAIDSEKNINSIHYREFSETKKPEGIVYLPTTSYYEMGEWSLFTDGYIEIEFLHKKLKEIGLEDLAEKYVKGSIWKNFLVKYPESNRIHKRTLELSKENKKIKKDPEYLEWLLKSQCNDVLWHGVFGGLYLPNLRDNAYRFIIEAEKRKDLLTGKSENTEIKDINFDGYDEVKISNKNFILIFDSKEGGQLTEFSLKKSSFNLQNTLTRRKEGYHHKILHPEKEHIENEEGISTIHEMDVEASKDVLEKLKFDWYTKNSFIDHITDSSINVESFDKCQFKEYGDFANRPFDIKNVSENKVEFERNGGIYKDKKFSTYISKAYKISEDKIEFEIKINSKYKENLIYLLEFNFHFADINNVILNKKPLKEISEIENENLFEIKDLYLKKNLILQFEEKTKLLTYTVETVSQSESGLDLTIQGQSFGFLFSFKENKQINGTLTIQ